MNRMTSASRIAASAALRTSRSSSVSPSTSDSARVPDHERLHTAQTDGGNPVAGDARLIVHDGNVASGKPVKESGLTDVRPADDRDLTTGWCFHCLTF